MNSASNPYRPAPGSLPPFLAGRDGERSAARGAISSTRLGAPDTPIVFTGLRGMGKTALLRACANDVTNAGGLVLYGEAGAETSMSDAFRRSLERAQRETEGLPLKLGRALERAIEHIPIPVFELPGNTGSIAMEHRAREDATRTTVEVLDELNRAARDHGRFVAICIDEIQEAAPGELRGLITLLHETHGTNQPMLWVSAGLPGSREHLKEAKTYSERWRYFELGLLNPPETSDAIARPARDHDTIFEEPALQALVDETAGYPFFIQEYAAAVWTRHEGSRISKELVDAIVPGVRRTIEQGLYEVVFRGLTPREIAYILALHKLGEGPQTVGAIAEALGVQSSSAISSIRNRLIVKDVIVSPGPSLVEFRLPLSNRYIENHRSKFERIAGPELRPRRGMSRLSVRA